MGPFNESVLEEEQIWGVLDQRLWMFLLDIPLETIGRPLNLFVVYEQSKLKVGIWGTSKISW